ncbi:hypothetical protein MHH81_20820 [Psychrobacillus sp. FSL H8-0484]|uniref:hypothetical protein n=1 Tax=Psychrobacillus sp. FSL H8-0484 TaxID=2921390 RepID=UPI0030F8AF40
MSIMENVLMELQSKITEDMVLCNFILELTNNNLLTDEMYEIFITEERSYGEVPFVLNNGIFEFPFMDCSKYEENLKPTTIKEEMYIHIYHMVNSILSH